MTPSYAIVAIVAQDDYVWQVSSEPKPHLTLLYLGDHLDHIDRVQEYIAHAVDTSLSTFGMDVKRRGPLGPDSADVLFLGDVGRRTVDQFRAYLLQNPDISTAYNSTTQFPEWVPHVTMGHPDTPAKSDPRDHLGFSWVRFDKIALWTGDNEGVEFPLKNNDDRLAMTAAHGANFLEHHGIKGMHWGVRRSDPSMSGGTQEVQTHIRRNGSVKAVGGKNHSPHEDAVSVAVAKQKAKRSSTDSLSTKELQQLVTRLNLEQQYTKLIATDPKSKSDLQVVLKKVFAAGKTVNDVNQFLNTPAGKVIKSTVTTAVKAKLGK